jgi:hypothetical protein
MLTGQLTTATVLDLLAEIRIAETARARYPAGLDETWLAAHPAAHP